MSIPKRIHQLWIGPKPAPITLMNTWREKHPNFEYIFWNETEFVKRNMTFLCQDKINAIEEINGKADIMRWEILYKYGGVFLDADSICIEPIDEELMMRPCFAGWEHEQLRKGLIATGTMGFPKEHPLIKDAIDWIYNNPITRKDGFMAWQSVGPGLLTRMCMTGKYPELCIYPSYTFLPIHSTGAEYTGHGKVYAFQAWGSTTQGYDRMNLMRLPRQFTPPTKRVSILISSYNTNPTYIEECLHSIKQQEGWFHIELVWINDGSDEEHTRHLKLSLDQFIQTTRFTSLIYDKHDSNRGIGFSLHKGVEMCSNEIICKMDSDDIMVPMRIQTQLVFMEAHPDVHICGGQVTMFTESLRQPTETTHHPSITLTQYCRSKSHWIANHPTLCYRKSSVLAVGSYDPTKSKMTEDFDLTLKMLKKYKYIHNFGEPLVYYRIHSEQVTNNGGSEGRQYWQHERSRLIDHLLLN
ncbi:MAG: glycosyltransferase [Flavobacterium sp.]